MCPTDEYAIIDFRSVWRIQIILVTIAPVNDREISGVDRDISVFGIIIMNRAIPYPPSLSKIAASTIDPAIGASTCALGSQRWVENIGSFTKNPIISINPMNNGHFI